MSFKGCDCLDLEKDLTKMMDDEDDHGLLAMEQPQGITPQTEGDAASEDANNHNSTSASVEASPANAPLTGSPRARAYPEVPVRGIRIPLVANGHSSGAPIVRVAMKIKPSHSNAPPSPTPAPAGKAAEAAPHRASPPAAPQRAAPAACSQPLLQPTSPHSAPQMRVVVPCQTAAPQLVRPTCTSAPAGATLVQLSDGRVVLMQQPESLKGSTMAFAPTAVNPALLPQGASQQLQYVTLVPPQYLAQPQPQLVVAQPQPQYVVAAQPQYVQLVAAAMPNTTSANPMYLLRAR